MRALAFVLAVAVTTLPAVARAGDEKVTSEAGASDAGADAALFACAKPGAKFSVSLKPDVELKDLVTWAMGFSCKKFLYSSSLATRASKVTMITPGAMSPPQAWGLFEQALHSMGLTIVAKGSVLEILESPSAKDEALAIAKTFPDGGTSVVRLLLRPEHVDAADLAAALELVKSKNGVVTPLPKLRALLVTDDADHVARMRAMIVELDVEATGDTVFAIPLVHVDAASVVTTVKSLLDPQGAQAASAPHLRLVADPRSNALFVAGSTADYARVKAIANAIDVETAGDSSTHLIHLKHAHAKDLAQTINTLISASGAQAQGGQGAQGTVHVTADEASNSLLVMASAHDAANLRALVDEMDAPVQQVYLEALVLEIEASNDQQVGVAWHGGRENKDGSMDFGGLLSDGLSSIAPKDSASNMGFLGGTIGSLIPGSEKLLGTTIPSYGLLLHAATHTSHLDVLASPHLMTIDNKEAKISVGVDIPYRTSQNSVSTTGQVIPGQIGRQKVALTLAITPHVGPAAPEDAESDREVSLDIKLEHSELGTETFGGDLGPTWKERTLDTSVVLRDEETLVLGGLVDERVDDTVDKIPLLGDIPLLGRLFQSSKKIRTKQNLLILITPHVIADSREGRAILERRMRERREFLRSTDDLERRVWEPPVHPEKLRGLIADIDAQVHAVERERAELDDATRAHGVAPGPVAPETPAPK
ncbi:MAG TPA: type II secretion system secretin GspD [Kofleriaceae bacterium]|nr:type II secretion system secretin GspD [Kofleriaceae bacterium]